LTKLWDQRKLKQSAKVVEKQFWTAPSLNDGVQRLKKGDDFPELRGMTWGLPVVFVFK